MLSLGTTVFDCIEAYAPGFKSSVLARDILTPPDLERIFGLPGGVSGLLLFNFLPAFLTGSFGLYLDFIRKS